MKLRKQKKKTSPFQAHYLCSCTPREVYLYPLFPQFSSLHIPPSPLHTLALIPIPAISASFFIPSHSQRLIFISLTLKRQQSFSFVSGSLLCVTARPAPVLRPNTFVLHSFPIFHPSVTAFRLIRCSSSHSHSTCCNSGPNNNNEERDGSRGFWSQPFSVP